VTRSEELFERAKATREERTHYTESYDEFKALMEGARPGFVYAPWCDDAEVEARVKTETQATIRNYPFDAPSAEGKVCFVTGRPATVVACFAKAY